jgi:phosphatidylserine/phosphatidylglycerophosphate/cardiolipin synthase-like enzyme
MEISAHFSDIQMNISEEIKKAKYNIFVAVAWITDESLWTILQEKANEGVVVQVILIPDEINKNNKLDFIRFSESGGQLFWDDHHHKFCVIDVKTVITGSYNWTYMASNRGKRENIVVIKKNSDIAEQFSDEFKILLKHSKKFEIPKEKEIIYLDREVTKEVVKIVEVEKKIDSIKIRQKEPVQPEKVRYEIIFGIFNGGIVKCGKCKNKLSAENFCVKCQKKYKYSSISNKYECLFEKY